MPPLASLAEFKVFLDTAVTADDAVLNFLLDVATARIETYCNRTFALDTYEEILSGSGDGKLVLRNVPVTAFTKLEHVNADGSLTEVPSGTYRVDPDSGVIARRHAPEWWPLDDFSNHGHGPLTGYSQFPRFNRGYRNYKATYTAGYATIPPNVKMACIEVAKDMFKNRRVNRGMAQESLGGGPQFTARTPDESMAQVHYLLAPFLRHPGMLTV